MKTGSIVRVKQPAPIEGKVVERRISKETDELEHLVEWTDASGAPVRRWFDADSLELRPDESKGDAQTITAADVGDVSHVLGGEQ